MTSLARPFRHPLAAGLLGAAALALLAGCGGGGGGGGDNNPGPTPPPSVSVTESNGLRATLTENTGTVGVGGGVTYTLTLSNPTAAAVTTNVATATEPPASLRVTDPGGSLFFSPVPGQPPLNTVSLAPGQSLTLTVPVTGFATRGTYNATATFGDTGAPVAVGPLAVTVQ